MTRKTLRKRRTKKPKRKTKKPKRKTKKPKTTRWRRTLMILTRFAVARAYTCKLIQESVLFFCT